MIATISVQLASTYFCQKRHAKNADLVTPNGSVSIKLDTHASASQGTIDWAMTFRDGSVGRAYSRTVEDGKDNSIYSFVLMAPPVPLEALEGALKHQTATLSQELKELKIRMEE